MTVLQSLYKTVHKRKRKHMNLAIKESHNKAFLTLYMLE